MNNVAAQWYQDLLAYEQKLKRATLNVLVQNNIYVQMLAAKGININANTPLSSDLFRKAVFVAMTPFQFSQQEYDKLYDTMSKHFDSNASAIKKLKSIKTKDSNALTQSMFQAAGLQSQNYSYSEAEMIVHDAMEQFRKSIQDIDLSKQKTAKASQIDWTTKGFVNEILYQELQNKSTQEDFIKEVFASLQNRSTSTLSVSQSKTKHLTSTTDFGHDLEWMIYQSPTVEEIAQGITAEVHMLYGEVKTSFKDGTGVGVTRTGYPLTEEVQNAILASSLIPTLNTQLIKDYNRKRASNQNLLLFDYLQHDYPSTSTLITLQKEDQEAWFLGDMIDSNLLYLDPQGLNLIQQNTWGYTNYTLTYAKGKFK